MHWLVWLVAELTLVVVHRQGFATVFSPDSLLT